MMRFSPGITSALLAALLFGASTPVAKLLLRDASPLLLAGLLYAGSGVGLLLVLALRRAFVPAAVSRQPVRAGDPASNVTAGIL